MYHIIRHVMGLQHVTDLIMCVHHICLIEAAALSDFRFKALCIALIHCLLIIGIEYSLPPVVSFSIPEYGWLTEIFTDRNWTFRNAMVFIMHGQTNNYSDS